MPSKARWAPPARAPRQFGILPYESGPNTGGGRRHRERGFELLVDPELGHRPLLRPTPKTGSLSVGKI